MFFYIFALRYFSEYSFIKYRYGINQTIASGVSFNLSTDLFGKQCVFNQFIYSKIQHEEVKQDKCFGLDVCKSEVVLRARQLQPRGLPTWDNTRKAVHGVIGAVYCQRAKRRMARVCVCVWTVHTASTVNVRKHKVKQDPMMNKRGRYESRHGLVRGGLRGGGLIMDKSCIVELCEKSHKWFPSQVISWKKRNYDRVTLSRGQNSTESDSP